MHKYMTLCVLARMVKYVDHLSMRARMHKVMTLCTRACVSPLRLAAAVPPPRLRPYPPLAAAVPPPLYSP